MSVEQGAAAGAGWMRSRHDLGGTFLFASAASTAILGLEPSALVGTSLRDVVAAEDAPLVERALASAAATDEPIAIVCRVQREAAPPRHVELCLLGERRSEGGNVVEIQCVARDVTPAVEAARRNEEQARRMKLLIDSVPGALWGLWSPDGSAAWRPLIISEYTETMTGYSVAEWLANPNMFIEIVHPDDRAEVEAQTQALFRQGESTSQFRWVRRDGRVIWVEAYIRLTRDGSGAVVGMSGATMDITARKEADEARGRVREEVFAELSTPLIPVHEGVVVMPLIGNLDRARAGRVVEALLNGVTTMRARVAVLDITGVPAVDVEVADALVRAAKGVRLLGAQVVLTGIRPEVAQAFVTLGTDFQGIVTRSTLQAGVRYAIEQG